MSYDYDVLVIGSGPAGQKAAIQAAKLRRRVALVERARTLGGVSVNIGHDPLEDDSRGDRLPDRPQSARDLRPGLPPARRDLGRRPSHAYAPGRRARAQRRPRPARAQPRLARRRHRALRRRARDGGATTAPAQSAGSPQRRSSSRPARHPPACRAWTFNDETVFDSDGILQHPAHPRLDRRGRRRRHRHRVRVDVRGARQQGDGRRRRGRRCSTSAIPRSSRRCSYHLRDLGVIFRFGEIVTAVERPRRTGRSPSSRAASRSPPTPSSTRPAGSGRDGRPAARAGRTARRTSAAASRSTPATGRPSSTSTRSVT